MTGLRQPLVQCLQLALPPGERRLGQALPRVMSPDRDARLRDSPAQGVVQLIDIRQSGPRRAIAIIGILAQEPAQNLFQCLRYRDAQRAQRRYGGRQLLTKNFADVAPVERRVSHQAFKEDDTGRIQIRPAVDGSVQNVSQFGRHVAGRGRGIVERSRGRGDARHQTEVDQCRHPQGGTVVDHYVGGPDVTVNQAMIMESGQ